MLPGRCDMAPRQRFNPSLSGKQCNFSTLANALPSRSPVNSVFPAIGFTNGGRTSQLMVGHSQVPVVKPSWSLN